MRRLCARDADVSTIDRDAVESPASSIAAVTSHVHHRNAVECVATVLLSLCSTS